MLSKTAEYALRVVVYLARNPNMVCTREEIAKATVIPFAYLTKVLGSLEKAMLVTSKRGPRGGYVLAGAPDAITAYDVIAAVKELPRIEQCPLGISEHIKLCPLHAKLDAIAKLAEDAFRRTQIKELLPPRGNSTGCVFPGNNG